MLESATLLTSEVAMDALALRLVCCVDVTDPERPPRPAVANVATVSAASPELVKVRSTKSTTLPVSEALLWPDMGAEPRNPRFRLEAGDLVTEQEMVPAALQTELETPTLTSSGSSLVATVTVLLSVSSTSLEAVACIRALAKSAGDIDET